MAVVIVHIAAVGVSNLELRPGNQIAGYLILLLDHQGPGPLVPERQLLHFAALDEDVLGGSV